MPGDAVEKTQTYEHSENYEPVTKIDTHYNDEAVKVLATYEGANLEWDAEEERHLVRKVDRRLVPLMFLTYGLVYYDKAMISQAALFGLRTDLELTGNRYSFSSSIFYLGAMAGALPIMLLAQHFPVERVASGIIALWGVTIILTIECHDYRTLYVNRFFLGLLESGINPMLMVIVASFYKKEEQPLRLGAWWSSAGFFSMFAPLVNYGLGHVRDALSPWKYMYIFAGSITILWSLVILFYLPPDPVNAHILSERERYVAVARLRTNNTGVRNTHFKVDQALEVLRDPRFLIIFIVAFCVMVANGPLSTYMPIIISGFGFSPLDSLLLSIPAGAIAGIFTLISTWLAGKYSHRGWRTWFVILFQLPIVLASLLLWQLPSHMTAGRLASVYLLGGFAAPYGIVMSLQSVNTAGYTKKTVTASGLFIGYCLGSFIYFLLMQVTGGPCNFTGPLLFKPEDAPKYESGWQGVVTTAIIALGLIVLYRLVCVIENKRRDKTGISEGLDHAFEDSLSDIKNPQFRYQL